MQFSFFYFLIDSIEIALTIEPESIESTTNSQGPSSSRRLRALQVVHGYMLQDPDVKNRLTVWFTGGKLLPSKPPKEQEYGSFEDWKQTFDSADQTSTWGESLKNMGAKLLLGAEFPQGMELDGSMAYTLHRPYGGHGKGFVDVSFFLIKCGYFSHALIANGHFDRYFTSTKTCILQKAIMVQYMFVCTVDCCLMGWIQQKWNFLKRMCHQRWIPMRL